MMFNAKQASSAHRERFNKYCQSRRTTPTKMTVSTNFGDRCMSSGMTLPVENLSPPQPVRENIGSRIPPGGAEKVEPRVRYIVMLHDIRCTREYVQQTE